MPLNGLVALAIYLVILGIIFYLLDWAVGMVPLFEPVRMIIRALFALILVVYLLEALGLVTGPPFPKLLR